VILVFFRHAIALDRTEAIQAGVEDEDRPITKEGKEKAKRMAALLNSLDLGRMEIISSPFVRAVETAQILKKELDVKTPLILTEDLLPERNFTDFYGYLKQHKAAASVMVFVGHEPNLGHLVSTMLGGGNSFVDLKKAGFAVLEVETVQDLQAGNAKLHTLVGPRILS